MEYAKLSIRTLRLRWRQYISLFLILVFGVSISLFLIFTVSGMISALTVKARIYYGGDILFLGSTNKTLVMSDVTLEQCRNIAGTSFAVAPRYELNISNAGRLFFEGDSVRQRYVKGVDFSLEQQLFEQYFYVEGSVEYMAGSNGILISEAIAQQLRCHAGDTVTLLLQTNNGYTNTVPFIVRGIFRDSSIFGMYTSYVDIELLQKASGISSQTINRINFISTSGRVTDKDVMQLYEALEKSFHLYPLVDDKNLYLTTARSSRDTIYGLFPLSANMEDLAVIITAMHAITFLVITVLVLIIVIGIASTYRVIVSKRITEISIYKSLGMSQSSIYFLIGTEALTLLIAGTVTGSILSFLLCGLVRLCNFTGIPSFDIFLTGGILQPIPRVGAVAGICLLVTASTLAAVFWSVRYIIKKMPSEAMTITM